jgi:hypothetical protein
MRKGQYGFLLLVAVVAGFVGGALSMQFTHGEMFPFFLLPNEVHVRKGFAIINNEGKRRALLEKSVLTFFNAYGEPDTILDSRSASLTLYNEAANRSVQVSASAPYIIRLAQSAARHTSVKLPEPSPGVTAPKLGIAIKDGKVVWEIP